MMPGLICSQRLVTSTPRGESHEFHQRVKVLSCIWSWAPRRSSFTVVIEPWRFMPALPDGGGAMVFWPRGVIDPESWRTRFMAAGAWSERS